MGQTRYESHKYARLNSLEASSRTYDDDDQQEIVLNDESSSRVRFGLESDEDVDLHAHDPGYSTTRGNSATNSSTKVSLKDRLNDSRLMQMAICSLATILLYLFLSICLTFYQKALIKELKFPLSIVTYHLLLKLIIASTIRAIYKCVVGKSRIQLDFRTSVRKMGPTGLASGIDIGFSNWGLELVPISLYTMTKSSTIVFILIFAIMLGLEKKSWSLVFIVSLIALGLFMFTYKSTQFHALGFVFILVASLSGGIRWSLAQFLMQKSKLGLHNPIDMIYHMQPWMILALLPFVIIFEGKSFFGVVDKLSEFSSSDISMVILKITFGAAMAFCMEVAEFLVLVKTSSLTLSIAGIFKDIFQLALAVAYNGDQLTLVNCLGLVVCLAGISCHILHKYSMLSKNEINLSGGDDDSFDMHYSDNTGSVAFSAGHSNAAHQSGTINSDLNEGGKKHSSLTVPLLEETDSEDDTHESPNKDNSSDVIFDILKRRDNQR
ncbi:solute carrier family 35 member C2 [Musca vetustissima]|uniref:solute carrier family 35 member C2 n=1 Tax=Musca vetustissima TaxID=27455 RepID=UPI002AB7D602|nr:solute carrier family 35 member C2 [Musca vetustissima]